MTPKAIAGLLVAVMVVAFASGWAGANVGGSSADSIVGAPGPDGAQGSDAPAGLDGERGAAGAQGEPGELGAEGDRGPQGIQGAKGDTGDQGIQGVPGAKGDTGDTGPTGLTGDQHVFSVGSPGLDLAPDAEGEVIRLDGVPPGTYNVTVTAAALYVAADVPCVLHWHGALTVIRVFTGDVLDWSATRPGVVTTEDNGSIYLYCYNMSPETATLYKLTLTAIREDS